MTKKDLNIAPGQGQKRPKRGFYMVTTPWWLRCFFPGCRWDIKTTEKTVYLTFDDGPHPEITPFVLNELQRYNARATFFCIGDNVRKYPEVFQQVIAAGHTVGNHSMHHINGWSSSDAGYLADIKEAGAYIPSPLFRPPYGRIKRSQLKKLLQEEANGGGSYRVIMWSVLAGDWDAAVSPQNCLERVKDAIYPGCIVVFHDSEKAYERMRYALPLLLNELAAKGYSFKAL